MLADWVIEILRCPETRQRIELRAGALTREDGKVFVDRSGVASLVYPDALEGDDAMMNRRYEIIAPIYDWSERMLGRLLTGVDMARGRAEIVALSCLEPGSRLLEVSPGPGVFFPLLREAVGPHAQFAATDLSLAMLLQCQKRRARLGVELVQANAHNLPFADGSFDALFHFGGVNLFNDPQKALSEFVRVVRKGGTVVWGDEQMSERFHHPVGRRVLPRLNPGFLKTPPAAPDGLGEVQRHEVHHGLGYLAVASKQASHEGRF